MSVEPWAHSRRTARQKPASRASKSARKGAEARSEPNPATTGPAAHPGAMPMVPAHAGAGNVRVRVSLDQGYLPSAADDVKIVWQGGRIARLIFPSGKIIEFD